MQYTISHPLRVRELKPLPFKMILNFMIAPLAGAWIETIQTKLVADTKDRTPCGCVNWNIWNYARSVFCKSHPLRVRELKQVWRWCRISRKIAPLAGAWIETVTEPNWMVLGKSHPLRVRELKLAYVWILRKWKIAPLAGAWIETFTIVQTLTPQNRTPCGCVNWNHLIIKARFYIKSHPLRVRELKL